MKALIHSLLLIALPSALMCGSGHGRPETGDMNILMIVVEDWSAFAIGAYGNEIVQTPNVDRLAATGIRFDRAYCQAPVCNPSRASFMTGLRPDSSRVYGNGDHMDEHVPAGAPDLAVSMSGREGAHIATAGKIVHKWQHAERFTSGYDALEYTHRYDRPESYRGNLTATPGPEGTPEDPEEEVFFLPDSEVTARLAVLLEERNARLAAGEADSWALRKPFQQLVAEQLGDSGLPEEMMEDGRLARSISDQLTAYATDQTPFFLSVGLYAPHTPLLAPRPYVDLYPPEDMVLSPAPASLDVGVPLVARRNGRNYDIFNGMYPEYGPTEERQREALAAYYACSTYLDAQIGIILDTLEATGLAENTIVVFFADHGFQLGEHDLWSKYTLFEQSTRVPFIIRVPGADANGQTCDRIVELVDVFPTLCDFWGIEKPTVLEGDSLHPLIEDPDRAWKQAAFSMIGIRGLGRSVRTTDFRYAEWRRDKSQPFESEPVEREFYDLVNDPWEQQNLIDDPLYQEQIRQHARLLKEGYSTARP
jgi:uncharacterized sulfatase